MTSPEQLFGQPTTIEEYEQSYAPQPNVEIIGAKVLQSLRYTDETTPITIIRSAN